MVLVILSGQSPIELDASHGFLLHITSIYLARQDNLILLHNVIQPWEIAYFAAVKLHSYMVDRIGFGVKGSWVLILYDREILSPFSIPFMCL